MTKNLKKLIKELGKWDMPLSHQIEIVLNDQCKKCTKKENKWCLNG